MYTCIVDPLCCTAESNTSQLYPSENYFKKRKKNKNKTSLTQKCGLCTSYQRTNIRDLGQNAN